MRSLHVFKADGLSSEEPRAPSQGKEHPAQPEDCPNFQKLDLCPGEERESSSFSLTSRATLVIKTGGDRHPRR